MSGSNTIVVIGRVEYPDEASHDHLRLIHTNKEEGTFWYPLLFGARDGTRLHLRFAQIIVRLRRAVAGNSPPDYYI